jgi:hypothetical protein
MGGESKDIICQKFFKSSLGMQIGGCSLEYIHQSRNDRCRALKAHMQGLKNTMYIILDLLVVLNYSNLVPVLPLPQIFLEFIQKTSDNIS